MKTYGLDETLDIVAVGARPAAFSVVLAARESGLRTVAIDKGPVSSALCSHPTYMRWFSRSDKLELGGSPLLTTEKNPTRQESKVVFVENSREHGPRIVHHISSAR